MNVLSLFDGISCGQLALQKAGVSYDNYYASEIDKHAIKVTQYNYPNTIQLGSIKEWRNWELPKIDLLIGGSPCQGFSISGNKLNFNDPRSRLFFYYVDILKELKPKYFLLENVKMKKDWMNNISSILGVEPLQIDSTIFSAQRRERLYWTNIKGIKYPSNKNINAKDILANDVTIIKNGLFDEEKIELKLRGHGWLPNRVILTDKIPPLFTSNTDYFVRTKNNTYRKLTPIEYERLQTIKDDYTSMISETQRYKVLGNCWTVDVVAYILSFLKE